jgi:hypothetical protein
VRLKTNPIGGYQRFGGTHRLHVQGLSRWRRRGPPKRRFVYFIAYFTTQSVARMRE